MTLTSRRPDSGAVEAAAATRGAVVTAIPTGGVSGVSHPPPGGSIVSGNVYTSFPLRGGVSLGSRASLTPWPSFFARVGLEARFLPDGPQFAYSWGLGYDDWHPGTFSAQINHWGPIAFDEPDLEGAGVDLGYKLPLPEVVQPYLGAGIGLNIPFSRAPGVVTSVTIKPFGDVFIMAGLRATLPDFATWTWVYGFGLTNWRPFTLSVGYYNWGPNPVFLPNFEQNGSVSVALSWAIK